MADTLSCRTKVHLLPAFRRQRKFGQPEDHAAWQEQAALIARLAGPIKLHGQ